MADDLAAKLEKLQNQEAKLDPKPVKNDTYVPTKRQRQIRRQVYERYYFLRDAPSRTQAEADWEEADKEFGMVTETLDTEDWRSKLQLPDAFSAIQTQSQETIERKSRPHIIATEESDEPIAEFRNVVLTYNMNTTGYDYQAFLAKLSASSRGTAFRMDYWRTDKRIVKDPESVNEDGTIKYVDKEITDFDDDYTEWVPNELIYIDEKCGHIDNAVDMVKREILNIEEFHRIYDNKPGYFDTEFVHMGGETNTKGTVFKLPKDVTEQDVEILHYYNRSVDAYWIVANNITIHDDPLPSKHKELPVAVDYQYKVPGQFWGIGIPKVLHMLSEERKSLRNLNMDRQKMQLNKMFLHNSSFDIDDEDLVTRPHGLISVDTNGQDIRQSIVPIEYGDVPPSYFRTEEVLLEDIRRASGIDDRVSVSNSATTATQAAIVKESTLKRINLVSIANEMDTVIRIGRLKWSNIQFFYGTPRIDRIVEDNQEREKKVYRTISVQGRKFSIVNDKGNKSLKMEDIKGASALSLKPEFNRYLEGSSDISVDADIFTPVSKAIEQTKKTEMFSLLLSNPATLAVMDVNQATADLLKVNNIKPDTWLKNVENKKDMMMLAESENMVMAAGQPLAGTENASEDHTLVHLMYTKTQEFQQQPHEVQQIIMDHIMQEHDANPATGASGELMGQYGLGDQQMAGGAAGQMAAGIPGMAAPFAVGAGQTTEPQAQVADLQPTNFANPE
jgi:hypothetical protein